MHIGLIGMKCDECGSRNNTFDERMGERICDDCGLVIQVEAFEETVRLSMGEDGSFRSKDYGLGSETTFMKRARSSRDESERTLENGYRVMRMVVSSLKLPFNINDRLEQIYRELMAKGILSGSSLETRATAIVYYALKENRTPATLKEVCGEFQVQSKLVRKLTRRITRHYGNNVLRNDDSHFLMQRAIAGVSNDPAFMSHCLQTFEFFEKLMKEFDENKTKLHYATMVYFTSYIHNYPYSATSISEKLNCSANGIRISGRRLLPLIGLKGVEQLKGIDLEKLM
jgi:transcription initiation factor TFIIB